MCGITGVYRWKSTCPVEEPMVKAMADELAHRGPDECSCFMTGNVGLGFRRLSIIDVSNGHQPFFSNDQNIVLICNGEIYNYKELRSALESKGYRFQSNCDVEVIVHLYREYHTGFLNMLNGQFAFVIYDKRDNTLFLARDHFGICPLFYTQVDGAFIFGSEVKAILKYPLVKREVDPQGLDQVFTFPGLVSPVTLFKNIFSLAPGHYITVSNEEVKLFEYWDLLYPSADGYHTRPESFYTEQLEDLLLRSVRYRMNADVPIGFYLSGGLDSSLIGGLMKSINPGMSYASFSIGFPDDHDMDERKFQQTMIRYLNASHTGILFDSEEIQKRLRQAVWAAECPLKETYNTCSLALSAAVREKGIKVVLSGEGADELFGGYVGYRFDKQRNSSYAVKDIEDQLEDDYRNRLWGDPDFFYEKEYYQFSEVKRSLYAEGVRQNFDSFNAVRNLVFDKKKIHNRHILHKRSYIDLKLRLSDHLIADHCDRVAYSNSVEGRYPFLDIDLIEFVKTIPPELKLKGLSEKYILKEMARKYIPGSIIDRQKFGFVAPGSPSLLNKNIEWINDLLSYESIKKQGYFDADVIERLKKLYSSPGFRLNLPFDSDLLIVVLTFNIFLELFEMPDNS